MAEYIDRNELELDAEWSEYHDGFTAYSQGQIQCAPTADVIERSKYDNLHNLAKSWLEEKKELEKANDELRSKIDKAIEEIKQEIQNGTIKLTSGNEKLFNILENIGE